MATHSDTIVLKATYDGDTRRMQVPAALTYGQLAAVVRATFGDLAEAEAGLKLTWTDSEGDVCAVASTPELAEAVRCAAETGGVLRLSVAAEAAATATKATATKTSPKPATEMRFRSGWTAAVPDPSPQSFVPPVNDNDNNVDDDIVIEEEAEADAVESDLDRLAAMFPLLPRDEVAAVLALVEGNLDSAAIECVARTNKAEFLRDAGILADGTPIADPDAQPSPSSSSASSSASASASDSDSDDDDDDDNDGANNDGGVPAFLANLPTGAALWAVLQAKLPLLAATLDSLELEALPPLPPFVADMLADPEAIAARLDAHPMVSVLIQGPLLAKIVASIEAARASGAPSFFASPCFGPGFAAGCGDGGAKGKARACRPGDDGGCADGASTATASTSDDHAAATLTAFLEHVVGQHGTASIEPPALGRALDAALAPFGGLAGIGDYSPDAVSLIVAELLADPVVARMASELELVVHRPGSPPQTVSPPPAPSTPAAAPVVHPRVRCDGCGARVAGVRWKCVNCPDFDLCEACEATGTAHIKTHLFLKIERPVTRQPKRGILLPVYYTDANDGNDGGAAGNNPDARRRGRGWRRRGRGRFGGRRGGGGARGRFMNPWAAFAAEQADAGASAPEARGCPLSAVVQAAQAAAASVVGAKRAQMRAAKVAEAAAAAAATASTSSTSSTPSSTNATNTATVTPTEASKPALFSRFVGDVTIFDGQEIAPGAAFTKIWRFRNDGAEAWPADLVLNFVGGDSLGSESVAVTEAPAPGEEVDVAVDMVAPSGAGRRCGYYRLFDGSGAPVGHRVWVDINVTDPAEAMRASGIMLPSIAAAAAAAGAGADGAGGEGNDGDDDDDAFGPQRAMLASMGLEGDFTALLQEYKGDVNAIISDLL